MSIVQKQGKTEGNFVRKSLLLRSVILFWSGIIMT